MEKIIIMKRLITLPLIISTALMADVPTTGDILRQAEPKKVPEEPKSLPSVTQEYNIPLAEKDDIKIMVKSFKFSGNSVFTADELMVLVQPYENHELGINGLKEVASIITKYYYDNGYFVSSAFIPVQSMENNVVEIAIIEGRYGVFDVKNSSFVDTRQIKGFMEVLQQGEVVSTSPLERQIILINELSGAQVANAEIYSGQAPGTSDFRIIVSPAPKYSGYAVADNYGSRYTGENRLSVGGYINSITGIGDTLSITGLLTNTANLKNIRAAYDRPIGYTGLKTGISAGVTQYNIDEVSNYEAYGQANSYNAYLSYPTIKTRTHAQSVEVSYDHKDMRDTSGIPGLLTEAEKQLDALTLQGSDSRSTSLLNLPGSLYTSVGYTIGHLGLKNDTAITNDAAGLNSGGNYTKFVLNAIHNQYIVDNTSLQTTFKAQKSFGKNLDSSEDLSVGGSNGVRAYEDSELSGDQGYALSLDLIYNLPKVDQITHNTSLFLDTARIWKNTTIFNTEDNIRNLNALGLGYSLSYQNFYLKATYAHGFGSESTPTTEAEFTTSKNKFLVQGMMRF